MNHLGESTRNIVRSRSLWTVAFPLLALVRGIAAEDKLQPAAEVITNIARIWSFPEPLRSNANPVKLTVTVIYYDVAWGLLWIQEGDHGLFCAPKRPFPAIRPGQQVEISAFTRPGAREVSLSNAQYRVLSETGFPAPRIISGPLPRTHPPDNIRCQIEGYVRRIQGGDNSHVRFEVVAGDMVVRAILLVTDRSEWTVLEDSFVRVTGVFTPKFDRDKKFLDAQMAIPGVEDVEVLETLSSNARFAIPVRTIASLQTSPGNELVRVQGTILRQEPGVSAVVQDETGRVAVETWQTWAVKSGDKVEAVGFAMAGGPTLRLREGMFRPVDRFETID